MSPATTTERMTNAYGSLVDRTTSWERTEVATVTHRHGAWLVTLTLNHATEDLTPDDITDAASSLSLAKRLAVRMARGIGCEGAVRWTQTQSGLWWLTMALPDTTEEFVEAGDELEGVAS